jgi:hypothetical protein
MVFFHDQRPSRERRVSVGCEEPDDVVWGDFAGGETPFPEWTDDEVRRLCDADKLVGHLSKDRVAREKLVDEWGCDKDRALWRRYATMFIGSYDAQGLPLTSAAWRRYESRYSNDAWREQRS